jgi:DNA processing protein
MTPRPGPLRGACADCLARSWLLARLAGHLDVARGRLEGVLALPDDELIAALAGRQASAVSTERAGFDADRARERARDHGLTLLCRCRGEYPPALRDLAAPPAVLHLAGSPERLRAVLDGEAVAVVGARAATAYGRGIARGLGSGLAAGGLTVLSGMALGIDGAAHAGALEGGGATIAVLPGGAERPRPAGQAALYRRIAAVGAIVSELPPGMAPRRWCYPARNRIIAALAALTVVVEAGERSGALITARIAAELGRPLGAVPGRVGAAQAAGPNALLAGGAAVIRGPQDVLDVLYGAGVRSAVEPSRAVLDPELDALRAAIAAGHDTVGALTRAGLPAERILVGLAELELHGHIRREPGGTYALSGS